MNFDDQVKLQGHTEMPIGQIRQYWEQVYQDGLRDLHSQSKSMKQSTLSFVERMKEFKREKTETRQIELAKVDHFVSEVTRDMYAS